MKSSTRYLRTGSVVALLLATAPLVPEAQTLSAAAPGTAEPPLSQAVVLTDLERTFWTCDLVALVAGQPLVYGEKCGAVADTIKTTRFGGNAARFAQWRTSNQAAAHRKILDELEAAPWP